MNTPHETPNRFDQAITLLTDMVHWAVIVACMLVTVVLLSTGTYEMVTAPGVTTLLYYGAGLITVLTLKLFNLNPNPQTREK